jgi:type I restriction enzyme S subunit
MNRVLEPRSGDVLINSTGTGTIGRSVTLNDKSHRYVVDGHVTVIRPSQERAIGQWINEALHSPWGQEYLESHCYAGSTNQIELSSSALAATPLAVPPMAEQRRIAEILDTLDGQIRATEQLIAKLRLAKQGLAVSLLTRGIDASGSIRGSERTNGYFVDRSIGVVPRSWEVAPLAKFQAHGRPFLKTGPFGSSLKQEHWVGEGIPVVTIGSLGDGQFIDSELLHVSESTAQSLSAYALEGGDIVFSRVADVGRSVVVGKHERGWIMSSNMMWISLDQKRVDPAFVRLNIAANPSLRMQIRRYVNSAGRDVANSNIMNLLQFPWPPIDEQRAIVSRIAASDAQVALQQTQVAKLHLLKKGLMSDLLTGRVRVSVEVAL